MEETKTDESYDKQDLQKSQKINLESRKSYLYLCGVKYKTVKISAPLHMELKLFTTLNGVNIQEFIEDAAIEALKRHNHTFQPKTKTK